MSNSNKVDSDKQITLSPVDPHYRKMAALDDPYLIAFKNYMKARFPND